MGSSCRQHGGTLMSKLCVAGITVLWMTAVSWAATPRQCTLSELWRSETAAKPLWPDPSNVRSVKCTDDHEAADCTVRSRQLVKDNLPVLFRNFTGRWGIKGASWEQAISSAGLDHLIGVKVALPGSNLDRPIYFEPSEEAHLSQEVR